MEKKTPETRSRHGEGRKMKLLVNGPLLHDKTSKRKKKDCGREEKKTGDKTRKEKH